MQIVNRQEVAQILRDWKVEVDLRATGAICPMGECGALVISYDASDSLNEFQNKCGSDREFVCSECGTEFTAPADDLLFQSVPREWLFSKVCQA